MAVNELRLGEERNEPLPRLAESMVERNRGMSPNCRIELVVEEGIPSTPFGEVGTNLLRILQEALTNVRRHSGASEVLVSLRLDGDDLVAEVADDGRGFDPKGPAGIGLRSMRERAAAFGGKLEIESGPSEGDQDAVSGLRTTHIVSRLKRRAQERAGRQEVCLSLCSNRTRTEPNTVEARLSSISLNRHIYPR